MPTTAYKYPEVGESIDGKYRIDKYLGEGGMGAVAKAWHTLRQAPVALKFMAPHLADNAAAVERFINEAVAASQLKSEHIVQVYDVSKLPNGAPYLVLEYLEGRDAAALVEKEGPLEVPRAAHIVFQVLRGLEVAHAAGIIHRDLKPANCFLIQHESDPEFLKILDFGISKIRREGSASITQTNMALGTPLYMSPEQARSSRDVDLRTDIYSTGVILYELLSGQAPHMVEGAEFTEVLYRLFMTDAPRITTKRAGLPEGLVKVVHTALERAPEARFQTARQFAEALAPFCDGRSTIEVTRFRTSQTHVVQGMDRVRIHSSPDVTDATGATQMGASPLPPTTNPQSQAQRPVTGTDATAMAPSIQPAVAQTDLSAAKDLASPSTTAASTTPTPRSSSLRLGLIAGAVAVVGAVVVYMAMRATPAAHAPPPRTDPTVTVSAPTPPVTAVVVTTVPAPSTTPSAIPSQAPSATTTTAMPTATGTHHGHLKDLTAIP